ncbi:MAG: peptidyl-prolyl cis-trans isomerase [Planctomycetota bacterium]
MPRPLSCALLLLLAMPAAPATAEPQDLAPDIAAMHPEGKWKIRKRDFYVHLARYNSAHPNARMAIEDYLQTRVVQREAARRNITVTENEVAKWLEKIDKQVREATGGRTTLEQYVAQREMDMSDFRRRARVALLRKELAKSIIRERDKTWPADKEVTDDGVTVAMDKLYADQPKVTDPAKLPKGVLAQVGDIQITEYDYGRQLARVLPSTEVKRALDDLILAEEVVLLLGDRGQPTARELEAERRAFLIRERNRLSRAVQGKQMKPEDVTIAMIERFLAQRGLSIAKVLENPGFLAQARARGHFMGKIDEEGLKEFYGKNQAKYGDRLRVQRILILSRAQPVNIAGKKVRTLEQGRAAANAIHIRLEGGEDFGKLAIRNSDDPDVIRKNGGFVPLWLTADAVGYEDTWKQANRLKEGEFTKPFFSAGRGFVIVRLLNRKRALGFAAQKANIRRDAAEYDYRLWQVKVIRAALRSRSL